jgi:hypothetical protein
MAQAGSHSPHPEIVQESDQLMEDDNSSTPHASTFNPDSRALSVTSTSGSIALSRSTSAPFPGRIEKNPGRSSPRHHSRNPTNQTERLKQQIALAFQFISSNIQQSQDENLVALDSLSEDAKTQYANLQLLQTRLAKGEQIVDTELTNAKKALATLEGATHQEQERLKAAIAHEFRRQEQQQQQDTSEAIGRDRILEAEVLKLKAQFNEQVKTQDAVWQQILKEQDDRATELLEQQKAEAIAKMERDRKEAKEFLERQKFEFQTTIQALTDRIDRAEKPAILFPQQKQVTAIRDHLTEVNLTLGYHLMDLTPKNNQYQLLAIKEKELIEVETSHHRHQVILVEIQIQIQAIMTMMTMGKRMMTGEGREDDQIAMPGSPLSPETLLPKLAQF